jgi:hypothetical protein
MAKQTNSASLSLGRRPGPSPGAEQVVDHDIECDDEGVEVGVHEASQEVDVAFATPTLGALASLVTAHTLNPIRKQSSSPPAVERDH